MVIFLLILIVAFLFRNQISAFIGLIVLIVLPQIIWDYWWGKLILICVGILAILVIVDIIKEKVENYKNKQSDDFYYDSEE